MKDRNNNPLILGQDVLIAGVIAGAPPHTQPNGPIVVRIGGHQVANGSHISVHAKDLISGIHSSSPSSPIQTGPATEVRKLTHVGLGEQEVTIHKSGPPPGWLEEQEAKRIAAGDPGSSPHDAIIGTLRTDLERAQTALEAANKALSETQDKLTKAEAEKTELAAQVEALKSEKAASETPTGDQQKAP